MKVRTPKERAELFKAAFPQYAEAAPLEATERWLSAVWIMGQNYKASGTYPDGMPFYGAFPPGYLDRVSSMFPDAERILHLFSGSIPDGNYIRFDTRPSVFDAQARRAEIDIGLPGMARARGYIVGDAGRLSEEVGGLTFDMVYADPPYSAEDAVKYGTAMVDRRRVMRELSKVVEPGGHLVWLDTVLPPFRRIEWKWWGNIAIIRSTNHRVRVASIFERTDHNAATERDRLVEEEPKA